MPGDQSGPASAPLNCRPRERKVLAVLLLYAALILFAILGAKVLDRQVEKEHEPLVVGEAT